VCPEDDSTHDIGTLMGEPNGRADILEAVEGLPCHSGGDGPESYVPALWATATGEGLSWDGGSIPPAHCPDLPDAVGLRRGYPCFRPGALPIVLLFGDNRFHNGPGRAEPYSFDAPEYDETTMALEGIGARVIGIFSGGGGRNRDDYERVATDSGAVRPDGTPLVFDIAGDGSGLDRTVVDAVGELVGGTPQDVTTDARNVPGNPDDIDATGFITDMTPLEGYSSTGARGEGYDSKDDSTFYGVIPGTQVQFEIEFQNSIREPQATAEIFKAQIIVLGNGVAELGVRNAYIVVPPDGSVILI
jgi:hypothetical protein